MLVPTWIFLFVTGLKSLDLRGALCHIDVKIPYWQLRLGFLILFPLKILLHRPKGVVESSKIQISCFLSKNRKRIGVPDVFFVFFIFLNFLMTIWGCQLDRPGKRKLQGFASIRLEGHFPNC